VRPMADADTAIVARILEKVRERQPVVHAMTNWVTAGDVADLLESIGAKPILAIAPEEVVEIVSRADSLLLNLGTPTLERLKAMILAGQQANKIQKPVTLDPVGAGASSFRDDFLHRLLSAIHFHVIRGNRAEMGTLAGTEGTLRGVSAVEGPLDIYAAARDVCLRTGAVAVVSGERDLIVGKGRSMVVRNGHPWMGRVTGMGCMSAAMIAAFLAVESDPVTGTAAALACFGVAGELAGRRAAGPGTFKPALLDALSLMNSKDIEEGARVEEIR
jgi:hydroxyethylthiazole kinase